MPDRPRTAEPTPAGRRPATRRSAAQRRLVAELLRVSPVADELGRRFAAAGHALALVGGSVRDALLGRLGDDLDFTTDARPERGARARRGWADAVWDVGIAFGTVGARKGDFVLEITTYRAEATTATSRKPEVTYGDTLEDDLVRRDFTVNAMAVALPGPDVRRPVRRAGRPRRAACCARRAAPEESFGDDPLRMMRAARFAAQLGFDGRARGASRR